MLFWAPKSLPQRSGGGEVLHFPAFSTLLVRWPTGFSPCDSLSHMDFCNVNPLNHHAAYLFAVDLFSLHSPAYSSLHMSGEVAMKYHFCSKYHTLLYHQLPKRNTYHFFRMKISRIPNEVSFQISGSHAAVQCQWLLPKSYWLQLPWPQDTEMSW